VCVYLLPERTLAPDSYLCAPKVIAVCQDSSHVEDSVGALRTFSHVDEAAGRDIFDVGRNRFTGGVDGDFGRGASRLRHVHTIGRGSLKHSSSFALAECTVEPPHAVIEITLPCLFNPGEGPSAESLIT
jgi:hypothetical protein